MRTRVLVALLTVAAIVVAFDRGLGDRRPLVVGTDPASGGGSITGQESDDVVGYVTTLPQAALSAEPGEPGVEVGPGVVLAVLSEDDTGYRVLDVCNREGWVAADQVAPGYVPVERGSAFEDAVFVIDAGHGFPDLGAVGPEGLSEADVNLDVASRIADLLREPRDINWSTGEVSAGTMVSAVADAVLTRPRQGPDGGDYEVGLTFRAELANATEATALVSIHHNSAEVPHRNTPGSEAYVSGTDADSARLGGLIVDELRRGLAEFGDDWVGGSDTGVIARTDSAGRDYYAVIEQALVPAVIVEGAYVSHNTEEALARTSDFRQAYAEGVYRALVRFVTSEDDPVPAPQPRVLDSHGSSRSMDDCEVPGPNE